MTDHTYTANPKTEAQVIENWKYLREDRYSYMYKQVNRFFFSIACEKDYHLLLNIVLDDANVPDTMSLKERIVYFQLFYTE